MANNQLTVYIVSPDSRRVNAGSMPRAGIWIDLVVCPWGVSLVVSSSGGVVGVWQPADDGARQSHRDLGR